jgi:hypothetical protein
MVFPEVGLGAEEAAQDPFVADERVNLEALLGSEGLETGDVLILERGKFVAVLADDELRVGVEAGFECVLGGDGLALGSARAGGFLTVEPVGFDLTLRSHRIFLMSTVAMRMTRDKRTEAGVVATARVDVGGVQVNGGCSILA